MNIYLFYFKVINVCTIAKLENDRFEILKKNILKPCYGKLQGDPSFESGLKATTNTTDKAISEVLH